MEFLVTLDIILFAMVGAATPLVYAGLGELVVEKSGVLNLGIEGMMLIGALAGFAAASALDSLIAAFLIGGVCGAIISAIFGCVTIFLRANQVATGLAVVIFCTGLSAFIGLDYVSVSKQIIKPTIPIIDNWNLFIFRFDIMIYLSWILVILCQWFLYHSRAGLILRAAGEDHHTTSILGYNVTLIRFLAVLFGGFMAGIGGAYLSTLYIPLWSEEMTAGRGWISLVLAIFAAWRPSRLLWGAYLFGGIAISQLFFQSDWNVPSEFLAMLPYLFTIIVLVVLSQGKLKKFLHAPADLGKPFEVRD